MISLNNKISFGWNVDTNTHSLITKKAVESMQPSDKFFSLTDKFILSKASQQPDYDDENTDYTGHFYNPVIKQSYKKSPISGKDSFIQHSQKAIELYSVNKTKSLVELGKASHFLQDAAQPYHVNTNGAFDSFVKMIPHAAFEDYVGLTQDKYDFSKSSKLSVDSGQKLANNSENFKDFLSGLYESTAQTTYSYNQATKDNTFVKGETLLNFAEEQTAKFYERFKKESLKQQKNLPAYSLNQNIVNLEKLQPEEKNGLIEFRNDTAKFFRNVIFSLTKGWIKLNGE